MHDHLPLCGVVRFARAAAIFALALHANPSVGAATTGAVETYRGACDASAAVALDAQHFIVGNDENDVLSTYRVHDATAVDRVDLRRFLGTRSREEADIEGAAMIGSRIYWITSHGRNSRGQLQPSRHRLFATEIVAGSPPRVAPIGVPYANLLQDLSSAPALEPWKLANAAELPAEATGGLNIEGLAPTPDGRLLVGFRNPVRDRRALVVPIDNPGEVVEKGLKARLGSPIQLDLGGRGIRSMALVDSIYYIVAGPIGDSGTFMLFRWSGRSDDTPTPMSEDLGTLRPEAVYATPSARSIVLLSDDGGILMGTRECKSLGKSRQEFRSLTIHL